MTRPSSPGLVFSVSFSGKRAPVARELGGPDGASRPAPNAPPAGTDARTTARAVPVSTVTPKTSTTVASPPTLRRDPVRRRRRSVADRLARQLALAHHLEREIESGRLKDFAEASRRLGISRARVTQVAALRSLAPSIQEAILEGRVEATERDLRPVADALSWTSQECRLDRVAPRWREPRSDAAPDRNAADPRGATRSTESTSSPHRPQSKQPPPEHRSS